MKFTKEWEEKISDRKFALRLTLSGLTYTDAMIKAECAEGEVNMEAEGGHMTQLLMAGGLAAALLKDFEGKNRENREAVFMASLELHLEQMKKGDRGKIEIKVQV